LRSEQSPDQYGYNYYDNVSNSESIYFRPPFGDLEVKHLAILVSLEIVNRLKVRNE